MTNKTRIYNTGKAITRKELDNLIKDAQIDGGWSKVEQANVSEINKMSYLFSKVNGIKDLNLDGWDTSNVEDMGSMFSSSDYNYPLNFDTSCVIDMCYMFYGSDYNHPLHFDTSNVEYIHHMFYGSKYNCPLLFDASNVTNMRYMFSNSEYNHPLDFDTSSVEDMEGIFENSSITHPIVFTGGDIPDDIQVFVDENNIAYEEKCKLDSAVHEHRDSSIIASTFKL